MDLDPSILDADMGLDLEADIGLVFCPLVVLGIFLASTSFSTLVVLGTNSALSCTSRCWDQVTIRRTTDSCRLFFAAMLERDVWKV